MRLRKFTFFTTLFIVISGQLFSQSLENSSLEKNNNSSSVNPLADKNNQKSNYDKLLSQASDQLKKKNYSEARKIYAEAAALDPTAKFPKSKIEEIDSLLDRLQKSNSK